MYKHPKATDKQLSVFLEENVNVCETACSYLAVAGNVTVDLSTKGKCVQDLLHIHCMSKQQLVLKKWFTEKHNCCVE